MVLAHRYLRVVGINLLDLVYASQVGDVGLGSGGNEDLRVTDAAMSSHSCRLQPIVKNRTPSIMPDDYPPGNTVSFLNLFVPPREVALPLHLGYFLDEVVVFRLNHGRNAITTTTRTITRASLGVKESSS